MPYIYDTENYDCMPAYSKQIPLQAKATLYPEVDPIGYKGINTRTAKVNVDNKNNIISVDVNVKEVNKPFIFTQNIPSKVWTIDHNLGKIPYITIIDSDGNTVIGEIKYVTNNIVKVEFSKQITGSAYLN